MADASQQAVVELGAEFGAGRFAVVLRRGWCRFLCRTGGKHHGKANRDQRGYAWHPLNLVAVIFGVNAFHRRGRSGRVRFCAEMQANGEKTWLRKVSTAAVPALTARVWF